MHDLVDNIAHKMAEERGVELGCDKKEMLVSRPRHFGSLWVTLRRLV